MFSAQSTRILDFPSKNTLLTANFYIMTPVLCQEACLFLGIKRLQPVSEEEAIQALSIPCVVWLQSHRNPHPLYR